MFAWVVVIFLKQGNCFNVKGIPKFGKSDPSKRRFVILTPPPGHIARRFGCPEEDTIDFKEKLN